ncbi:MAG: sigma-54 dependent transcriptional regulator [Acidobacteriota bacterium]
MAPILIVDDDRSVTASLSLLLKQAGLPSQLAHGPAAALEVLDRQRVSLVLQDMNFSRRTSGEEGLELLAEIRRRAPRVPVVLITAWGSIQLAVKGIQAGASDFVTKPWNNQHLLQVVRTALSLAQEEDRAGESRDELDEAFDFSDIIGEHSAVVRLLNRVARVCTTDAPVLILGESGTGKELIADAVHRNSRRSTQAFVKVNLGGIPASLFESEMFGHVRGAFTDAKGDRQGRFELADGGTIFLDEIGDLEKSSQVKLLRVLQDRTFQKVGSSATEQTDVRVISATHRDLAEMVQAETFREDLFYRLNLITLRVPPLRERRSDIAKIAYHHLRRVRELYGSDEIVIEDGAYRWLQSLPWPGNVRQLRQTIERAVLMSGRRRLRREDFVDPEVVEEVATARPVGGWDHLTLDQVEKLMIEKSLERHDNNISRAAADLGLSRAALYRRLEKHGLSA